MAMRGWNATDLAARAGLSQATLSHLVQGRFVSERSVKKICLALAREDPLPVADELVLRPDDLVA